MKKMLLVIVTVCFNLLSFGQINIDEFYENRDDLLIYSRVQEFDSISQEKIHLRIKNWAGTTFRNMNEVLVSETEEQMVFNYITSGFFVKAMGLTTNWDWHIIMIIKIKDNKIKVSLYDDGNSYKPASSTVYGIIPATSAHSIFFYEHFKEKKDSKSISRNTNTEGLINFRNKCLLTVESLINSIKNNSASKANENNKDDNW